ncbi:putative arp2/3 complex 34 kda subunit [Paratrimastix pyriformis]|uniref:Arp2/3 complex 34 kDa subunit n=1 Tax=Paratrimastix pyriformis TaxID=342808 RepID=A0ABQ8UEU1_9EUKA|nr:putative arp2/3 complex 34 kda subunit [Paratrimastix pyriformis]
MIYEVKTKEDAPGALFVGVSLPGFPEIMANGGTEMLSSLYGPYVNADKGSNDLSLKLTWASLPAVPAEREKIATLVANIKVNLLAAPMMKAIQGLEATPPKLGSPIQIPYRTDGYMWVLTAPDVLTVGFSVSFKDPQDQPLARIFLNEFVASQHDTKLAGAPRANVFFTRPGELAGLDYRAEGIMAYVFFAFNKQRHLAGATREKTLSMVQTFRNYFQYHLKCAKAYMHNRMRSVYQSSVESLNRARPETVMKAGTRGVSGKLLKKK